MILMEIVRGFKIKIWKGIILKVCYILKNIKRFFFKNKKILEV